MTTPQTPVANVLRPTPEARRRTYLYALIPAIPLLFVVLLNSAVQPRAAWIYLLLLLVAVALIVPYLVWWATATRIEFGGGRYRYVTPFFGRDFVVADVERMVAVDELFFGLNGARMLFVVGRTRRRLFRMNSVAWDVPQLELLVNDLLAQGVPLTHVPGRVTPAELDRRDPGLLRWVEVHRVAFVLLMALGAVVFAIVAVVVIVLIFTAAA